MSGRATCVIGVVLIVAACDPGDVTLVTPQGATEDQSTHIHAVLDTPYASLSATLGWQGGIPGATVRLHRAEEPYDSSYWVSATTDTNGTATFSGLLAGSYDVEVVRSLDASEANAAGNDVHIVAGGRFTGLPKQEVDVTAEPNHVGSLVFSEVAITAPLPWETGGGNYDDGKYLELYNDSNQTVYLDGMLLGVAYYFNRDYTARPCSMNDVALNDPAGIWTKQLLRFPGGGTDHPVRPGQVVVVAKSAVDHRSVHPTLVDLSHADFEWGGQHTADNPDVPNLLDVGPTPMYPPVPVGEEAVFLARATDLDGLPRWIQPYDGSTYIRIPAAAVVDAMAPLVDWTKESYTPTRRCPQMLNKAFERLPGPALWSGEDGASYSLQRRVIATLPDGRKLLQDTNTSMADFVRAFVTPGTLADIPGGA